MTPLSEALQTKLFCIYEKCVRESKYANGNRIEKLISEWVHSVINKHINVRVEGNHIQLGGTQEDHDALDKHVREHEDLTALKEYDRMGTIIKALGVIDTFRLQLYPVEGFISDENKSRLTQAIISVNLALNNLEYTLESDLDAVAKKDLAGLKQSVELNDKINNATGGFRNDPKATDTEASSTEA